MSWTEKFVSPCMPIFGRMDIIILEISRKLAMDTLDSEMVINDEEPL